MFAKAIDTLKPVFGFKSDRETRLDDAILTVLKTTVHSNVYLHRADAEQRADTDRENELAIQWSEAAVKAHDVDVSLSADCLSLAKAFSESSTSDADRSALQRQTVEAVFVKVGKLLA